MFPLSEPVVQGSLFANMALCDNRDTIEKNSPLPLVLKEIDQLTCLTGIYPGSLSELKICVQRFAKKGELASSDKKALAIFIQHFVQDRQKEISPRVGRMTLIEALEEVRSRPSLVVLFPCLMQVISLTGLKTGDWRRWDYHLQNLYPRESLAQPELKSWMNFWDFLKRQQIPSQPVNSKPPPMYGQESWKLQLQQLADGAKVPAEKRLSQFLAPSELQPDELAVQYQRLLNTLLAENNLMTRLRFALMQMRQGLGIDNNEGAHISIPERVTAIYVQLMERIKELDEGDTGLEFALFLHVHAGTSGIQSKCYLKRQERENFRDNLRKTERALTRLSALKAHLYQVKVNYSAALSDEKTGPLFALLLDYIATIDCKFRAMHFTTLAGDLYDKYFQCVQEEFLGEHLALTPAIELSLALLREESNSQEGLINLCRIERVYDLVETSQKELYALAKSELDRLVAGQTRSGKRAFLKFYKCLFDLPGAETTVPEQWPVWKRELPELAGTEFKIPAHYPQNTHIDPGKGAAKAKGETLAERPIRTSTKQTLICPPKSKIEQSAPLQSLKKSFPFAYHSRVTRWLKARVPLNAEEFPEYATRDWAYQRKMIFQHNFPLAADQFWQRGTQQISKQGDSRGCRRFILPAELVIDHLAERGLVVWAVNQQKICYHRYFHPKSYREICDKTMHQTFTDADFPEMSISREVFARESKGEKLGPSQFDKTCTVEIDNLLKIVTLQERALGIKLRLFMIDFDSQM